MGPRRVVVGGGLGEERRRTAPPGLSQHHLGEFEHEVGRRLARLVRDRRHDACLALVPRDV